MTELTKDEWLARCAKRYMERAGLDETMARTCADICREILDADPESYEGESPEDMADGDMGCWDNDEAA